MHETATVERGCCQERIEAIAFEFAHASVKSYWHDVSSAAHSARSLVSLEPSLQISHVAHRRLSHAVNRAWMHLDTQDNTTFELQQASAGFESLCEFADFLLEAPEYRATRHLATLPDILARIEILQHIAWSASLFDEIAERRLTPDAKRDAAAYRRIADNITRYHMLAEEIEARAEKRRAATIARLVKKSEKAVS